jgi:hypothetical protein
VEIGRAKQDTTSLRNWKADLLRLLATGVLTVAGLALAGWPDDAAVAAWVALAVALTAFLLVLAAEFAWNLALAPGRIARERHEQERALLEHQLAVARRTIAVPEVDISIWSGAFNEAAKGQVLPLEAILARRDVTLKARGLDQPLPDPTKQTP